MANSFKNAMLPLVSTTPLSVYTAPAGNTCILVELDIANLQATSVAVDVQLHDASAGANTYVVKGMLIPGNNALQVVVGQKIVLEENDRVYVNSNAVNSISVIASVLQGV